MHCWLLLSFLLLLSCVLAAFALVRTNTNTTKKVLSQQHAQRIFLSANVRHTLVVFPHTKKTRNGNLFSHTTLGDRGGGGKRKGIPFPLLETEGGENGNKKGNGRKEKASSSIFSSLVWGSTNHTKTHFPYLKDSIIKILLYIPPPFPPQISCQILVRLPIFSPSVLGTTFVLSSLPLLSFTGILLLLLLLRPSMEGKDFPTYPRTYVHNRIFLLPHMDIRTAERVEGGFGKGRGKVFAPWLLFWVPFSLGTSKGRRKRVRAADVVAELFRKLQRGGIWQSKVSVFRILLALKRNIKFSSSRNSNYRKQYVSEEFGMAFLYKKSCQTNKIATFFCSHPT